MKNQRSKCSHQELSYKPVYRGISLSKSAKVHQMLMKLQTKIHHTVHQTRKNSKHNPFINMEVTLNTSHKPNELKHNLRALYY